MMEIDEFYIMPDGRVSPDPKEKDDCAILVTRDGWEWSNAWFQLAITVELNKILERNANIAHKRIMKYG